MIYYLFIIIYYLSTPPISAKENKRAGIPRMESSLYPAAIPSTTTTWETFPYVLKCPTADIPDHALVEDQSEDVATDVKFCV